MGRVAAQHAPSLEQEFRAAAQKIREDINANSWSAKSGAFAASFGSSDLDASLLQMAHLRFLPLNDARLRSTIDAIREGLSKDGWVFRYRLDDGFGLPAAAFVICTFWLVEALADTGRQAEAKTLMDHVDSALTDLGLLSEDYDSTKKRLWGNFTQAYSHVGLIRAAFAASPGWNDVL